MARLTSMAVMAALFILHVTCWGADEPAGKQAQRQPQTDERPYQVSILSITPSQGEPGTQVVLAGAGFTETTVAYLGSVELPTRVASNRLLSFTIPALPAGLYSLYLRNDEAVASRSIPYTVLPLKPVITGLSPDTVNACSTPQEREVTVSGHNFQERSAIKFDGAIIRSRYLNSDTMLFTLPTAPAGVHQVQVMNPDDTLSSAVAVQISARPEIAIVSQGQEYVNYYELVIEGRNFQQGSRVVVDGRHIGGGLPIPGDRDRIVYVNCNRLVYQRYPYDTTAKSFAIQVVNPSGEESAMVTVNAP